jgi:mono/diheme cytochrome c family protein
VPGSRRPILSTGAALVLLLAAGCREDRLPEIDGGKSAVAAGKSTFERKCASCHGVSGDGQTMTGSRFKYANLIDGEWRGDGSLASIEHQIRKGHDPMPKFEGKLTDEEIRETAAYVLELAHRKDKK